MMMSIGELVVARREQFGWDQAELARRVGVGQQTISRWERGASRPRPASLTLLAATFDCNVHELLAAAGYEVALGIGGNTLRQSIDPLVADLPVESLSPDRFERLAVDLGQCLYPDALVTRYGGQGHAQQGVDVVATRAGQVVAAFQCKRHIDFGPAKVREAVAKVELEADIYYLLLARRTASPGARKEIRQYPTWHLWDGEDISNAIRRLPREDRLRIVETYFPAYSESFLGIRDSSPWLTSRDYFRPYSGRQIFTHDWDLVGRADVVEQIVRFASEDGPGIGVLTGRGGIGKSRLLSAVAQRVESTTSVPVRFWTRGATPSRAQIELLADDVPALVVVDDAHEISDLRSFLNDLGRYRPRVKLLLATRNGATVELQTSLRTVGLHLSELQTWHLDELTEDEGRVLARQALGPDVSESVVRRLAALTRDCPLVTVVGGSLIREGRLDASSIEQSPQIRDEILGAFKRALVESSTPGGEAERETVLELVAALQPFRIDDPAFRTALEVGGERPFDRLNRHLRALEDAGVLLRRNASLRVVPDLLGDLLLADACVDRQTGTSTGFIERIHAVLPEGAPRTNFFVNINRIDWQVGGNASATHLADVLWDLLEEEAAVSDIPSRKAIVGLLSRTAYYKPQRALRLVRWLVDNPTDAVVDPSPYVHWRMPTYTADVIRELGGPLKMIVFDPACRQDALDLLWELAQSDDRRTNQTPNHPLRVLTSLAEFDIHKPVAFHHELVDAVERWLSRDGWTHSPCEVLRPMLHTEGSETTSNGRAVIFSPFAVNPEATAPLRKRVLDLAFAEIHNADLRRAVRGVSLVREAFRGPSGLFGRPVEPAERARWTPSFVETINRLGDELLDPELDPLVVVEIRDALHWDAESPNAESATRSAARNALAKVPQSLQHELTLVLHDGWGHLIRDRDTGFEEHERLKEDRLRNLIVALTSELDDSAFIALCEERLRIEHLAYGKIDGAGPFFWTLVEQRPSLGLSICERVAATPNSPYSMTLPLILGRVANYFPHETLAIMQRLSRQSVEFRRAVAMALGWNRGARTSTIPGEVELLLGLARDSDQAVRRGVLTAASRIGLEDKANGHALLRAVDFSDSAALADEATAVFGRQGGLDVHELPESDLALMIDRLTQCPTIGDYHIGLFLTAVGAIDPGRVIDLLMARIELSEATDTDASYDAIPFGWDTPLDLTGSGNDRLTLLRRIQAWMAKEPESWRRQTDGAELLVEVAGGFDEIVHQVIREGLDRGTTEDVTASAAILRKAPRTIVWDQVEFVVEMLQAGARLGDEALGKIRNGFWSATISGVRSGTPGEPFAEDLDQRDRCRAVLEGLRRGSVEAAFYQSLVLSAEASIERESNERFDMDGRDW